MTHTATNHQISSTEGADYGTWEGTSPAAALLALHRDAGYGPETVDLVDGELVFGSDDDRELCGDVDDWVIM
jgi:hypothetical protein